ncbi:MAG: hypothetical protein O7E57_08660 [Gammaproteobacteria bacterium]|nr:hypothetical protein [Gammaproteobacteria bacterium]
MPLVSRYRQLGEILDLEAMNGEFARWLAVTANERIRGTTGEVSNELLIHEGDGKN